MTLNEAIERAYKIWGGRQMTVRLRADGGADCEFPEHVQWHGPTKRQWRQGFHQIDANGHPVCHPECTALEF